MQPNVDPLILVSEDLPGISVQTGPRRWIYLAYAWLLERALVRALSRYRPVSAVVSQAFLERHRQAATQFISTNEMLSLTWSTVDLSPLLRFHRDLVARYLALAPGFPASMVAPLSARVVLAGAVEHLARPAEALNQVFPTAGRLLLLGTGSPLESLAAKLAKARGWKVERSGWRRIFQPLARLKRAFARGAAAAIPGPAALASQYRLVSGGEAPVAESGGVAFFCIDERRIRRLSETIQRVRAEGIPASLAVLEAKPEVTRAKRELVSAGVPVHSLNHMYPGGAPETRALAAAAEARQAWESLFTDEQSWTHEYRGVRVAPWVKEELADPWAKLAAETALFRECAAAYLKARKPALLFLSDNSLHATILAQLGHEAGIPVLFYVYNPVLFTVAYWKQLMLETVKAGLVFTATDHMRSVFVREGGYQEAHVRVVGDVFGAKATDQERREARSVFGPKAGLREGDKVVLALSFFVGQDISEPQKRRFLRCAGQGAKACGAKLILKAHPNEDKQLLERMLKEEGVEPAFVAHTESLRQLLLVSDAACMAYSQAGMEAILTGVPLIIIQDQRLLRGYEAWVPYVSEGAALFVPDHEALAPCLGPVLAGGEARGTLLAGAAAFRAKYISSPDFDPLEKMVEQLKQVLEEQERK